MLEIKRIKEGYEKFAKDVSEDTMSKDFYLSIYHLTRSLMTASRKYWILDVGCGKGGLLSLFKNSNVIGLDISYNKLKGAKQKGISCIQDDALHLPIKEASVDIV